ncbi:type II secretion system F family protein [Actinomycetospora sp.]|jgi:pilus assembly protein TadC|uniref:type II secretion system F family protein n=1 Tax=Actinomycetospora sp. TaxID=1872135 RepID=UPI002F418CFD
MTVLAAGLVLLACAALIAPGPVTAHRRLCSLRPPEDVVAPVRRRRRERRDPWQEAGAWDELASCLRAGLSLDRAVRAVAASLPGPMAAALTEVADLLALGADPADAWAPALDEPSTARLARAARRSARSGAAVADVATTVAADVRTEAAEAVSARAERAGVLVAGPLGLCFLPAFLALGIAPVVIGLAAPLLERT